MSDLNFIGRMNAYNDDDEDEESYCEEEDSDEEEEETDHDPTRPSSNAF